MIWRTATIFISSTFMDMHSERDIIQMIVLPRLKAKFQKHKIAVRIVDLRWGIQNKTTEEEAETRILNICKYEIERSRPFFVGLLGYRYGWIPAYDIVNKKLNEHRISVTEMEFMCSWNPEYKNNCIYGIRSEKPVYSSDYYESDPKKLKKIKGLRARVASNKDAFYVFEYDLESKGELENKLFTSLSQSIAKVFNVNELQEHSDEEIDCYILDNIVQEFLYTYPDNFLDNERKIVQALLSNKAYVITNDPDNRRSMLLSNIAKYISKAGRDMIYYNTSFNNGSDKELLLLNYLSFKLSNFLGINYYDTAKDVEVASVLGAKWAVRREKVTLSEKVIHLLQECGKRGINPVLIVDGFEEINCNGQLWRELLGNFRSFILFSPNHDVSPIAVKYIIPNITEISLRQYIIDYYNLHHKELHPNVLDMLINRSINLKTDMMEWLDLALFWILNLGESDFKAISQLQDLTEEDKIESFLMKLISNFPNDVCEMMGELVTKTEAIFGNQIKEILNYIASSRFGLRDSDLEMIFMSDWDYIGFSKFRMWFAPFIKESGGDKRWNFTNDKFKSIINEPMSNEKKIFRHEILSEVLYKMDLSDPVRRTDLFYHLLQAGKYDKCSEIIKLEDKHYMYEIKAMLNGLNDGQLLFFLENIFKSCDINDSIITAAHLYLYLAADKIKEDASLSNRYISSVLDNVKFDGENLYEYTYEVLSVMLGDIILRLRQTEGNTHLLKLSCKKHVECVTLWYSNYSSQASLNAKNIVLYNIASYYISIGDFNTANRYFELM